MKTRQVAAHVIGVLILAGAVGAFGQTFHISPSVITNDYVGPITLSVGGLTNGQTVAIGEFMDVNGNGVIDSGEFEVRHFKVTDGVQSIIGGATNINVPGDTDGTANGQITVVLNYPSINETLDHIAGSYLFKLSDPNNVFTPVTNSFTILQASVPEGVTGTVYSNTTPMPNAVVILIQQSGNGGGGVVADASGHFSLSNAPGMYNVVAFTSGTVGSAAQVTISSNSFVNVNLTNPPATNVLAGTVSDSGTGQGLRGIFVNAMANNLITIGFTGTNGTFALPAVGGVWQMKLDSSSGVGSVAPFGYVNFQNTKLSITNTSGNVSNINFALPRAASLIYGRLMDSQSNGIAAATIQADSEDNLYEADGQTDANGRYAVGVFSNSWTLGPQNLPASYQVANVDVPIVNGQAVLQNLQAQQVTAYLYGKVVDGNGNPQSNIQIVVNQVSTNGYLIPLNGNFNTAGDGTFAIGLYGGTWNVAPECSSAGANGLVPPSVNFTVVDGINQSNIVLVEPFATSIITVKAVDQNGNPVNVSSFASQIVNGTNYSACSFGSGTNMQIAVFAGNWVVGVSGNFGSSGYDVPPNQNVIVPSGDQNVRFVLYPQGLTPPQLSNMSFAGGHPQFNLQGDQGQNYSIQASSNLTTWTSLATNTAFGGSFFFEDTNAVGRARFYRAVLVP